jgi:hypothetical protein
MDVDDVAHDTFAILCSQSQIGAESSLRADRLQLENERGIAITWG